MFDSLNRHMLPPYGCEWVHAPNFERLAQKSVTFEDYYVGSMPCMPARRDLHTGRYNFLHRSWGPLEPFDDSMPEILKEHGVYTHLVSDHYHYWEDGGATYHMRYSSFEFNRGQEGDPWKGKVGPVDMPAETTRDLNHPDTMWRQDWVNRAFMQREEDMPQARTFQEGIEFMRTNAAEDNWFLQIETFDPHEPFYTQQAYKDLYPHEYHGPHFDWPPYDKVTESPEMVQHMRYENAALVSMCDNYLGKVLDLMDELDLWKDTLLIVCTDHGFLLGEHDWWAKLVEPFYNEVAHCPLFIWDPRSGIKGERRSQLVQMIDFAPTLYEYFGVEIPKDVQGLVLRDTIAQNAPTREAVIYGVHGGHVNVTDGRYVYMRACHTSDNTPLFEYTLMPTHMRGIFKPEELQDIQLAEPFSFTKGCRTMKIASRPWMNPARFGNLLFDLKNDPGQMHPLQNPELENHMSQLMTRLMIENEAPSEQFTRIGLAP